MIPCYVSGKGMHASQITWDFKTRIIDMLARTKLGYDTRFNYYQKQFPLLSHTELARKICDPMEYYDKDWPPYYQQHKHERDKEWLITAFMLERDDWFRDEARVAIYCFDEAGFGSGVNSMRFLTANKPLLGFYNRETMRDRNINNIMQLTIHFPRLVTLVEYTDIDFVVDYTEEWLRRQAP